MIRRAFLTAAMAGLLATNLLADDAGLVTKGRELFQAKICMTCHQVVGDGMRGEPRTTDVISMLSKHPHARSRGDHP